MCFQLTVVSYEYEIILMLLSVGTIRYFYHTTCSALCLFCLFFFMLDPTASRKARSSSMSTLRLSYSSTAGAWGGGVMDAANHCLSVVVNTQYRCMIRIIGKILIPGTVVAVVPGTVVYMGDMIGVLISYLKITTPSIFTATYMIQVYE